MLKLGLIGHPVGHSLSPWIHGQLLKQQNLEGTYDLFDIEPEHFDTGVLGLKEKSLQGFNITVPYKERILPYLDEVDPAARYLGAVNTVKVENGSWVGYNTDGSGFVDSIRLRFPQLFSGHKKVLVLGSGGAARGIYHALLEAGFKYVDVANRTVDKARSMIDEFNAGSVAHALNLDQATDHLNRYDLVIQTTSVGMSPQDDIAIIPLNNLTEGTVVSDIVYRPMKTKFLAEAEQKGALLHYGHEMLLQQAVYAFEIWTKTNPNAAKLLHEFEEKLRGV